MPSARGMDVPQTPAKRAPGRSTGAKPTRKRARKKSAGAPTAGVTAANQPLEHRIEVARLLTG